MVDDEKNMADEQGKRKIEDDEVARAVLQAMGVSRIDINVADSTRGQASLGSQLPAEPSQQGRVSRLSASVNQNVESFFLWVVNHTTPAVLAWLAIIFVILAGVIAGFTTTNLAEWYSITGFYLTGAGFLYMIYALYRTRETARLEREAYRRAELDQRAVHYRYCLEMASRTLDRVSQHVRTYEWNLASAYAENLSEHALHIHNLRDHVNERWKIFSQALAKFSKDFDGGINGRRFDGYQKDGWEILKQRLRDSLTEELTSYFKFKGS